MSDPLGPLPESTPIDPETGDLRVEWRRFLKKLRDIVRELQG
jgi:hypothetical protein